MLMMKLPDIKLSSLSQLGLDGISHDIDCLDNLSHLLPESMIPFSLSFLSSTTLLE